MPCIIDFNITLCRHTVGKNTNCICFYMPCILILSTVMAMQHLKSCSITGLWPVRGRILSRFFLIQAKDWPLHGAFPKCIYCRDTHRLSVQCKRSYISYSITKLPVSLYLKTRRFERTAQLKADGTGLPNNTLFCVLHTANPFCTQTQKRSSTEIPFFMYIHTHG